MAATRDQTAKARLTRIILVMMQRIGIAHHRREQPYRFDVEDQALLKRFANFKGTRWRRPISVHDQAPQVRSSSAFPKYDYIRWPHRFSSVDEWVLVDVVDGGQVKENLLRVSTFNTIEDFPWPRQGTPPLREFIEFLKLLNAAYPASTAI
jgi:hypothetical protein